MQEFKLKLQQHVEHIKNVSTHCQTEETTKQALVLPFLGILGFNPYDPTKVQAECPASFPGAKHNERVDYALFSSGQPVMLIEAKPHTEKLTNHTGQLSRYFNATPSVAIAAVTNGREWRFFTDLKNQNIMDPEPFFIVDFANLTDSDSEKLTRFRFENFNSDKLKSFAEERVYASVFQNVIESCLRDPDIDFVKYVVNRSNLSAKMTTKFIENITPLVKQAVTEAISRVVVSGLSAPPPAPAPVIYESVIDLEDAEEIDPSNPKIITTVAERKLLSIIQSMLDGSAASEDIIGKDTESYYAVLYHGKVNRWLVRYIDRAKQPTITFCVPLTDQHKKKIAERGLELGTANSVIINKPEHVMKLGGIVFEALEYCMNDENFRVNRSAKEIQ